ncbi:MAG: NAD(+) kinase, partial [Bacteroidia bacterium]|nr:NAD(+) kinase [Bacteroidia bacterium]
MEKQNIQPVIFLPFFQQIRDRIHLPASATTFYLSEDLNEAIDFLISLGGDGTLLDTLTLIQDKKYSPSWGINFGHLGFL